MGKSPSSSVGGTTKSPAGEHGHGRGDVGPADSPATATSLPHPHAHDVLTRTHRTEGLPPWRSVQTTEPCISSWAAVSCSGLLWPAVACCGSLWAAVSCHACVWAAVGRCGLLWPVVSCRVLLWAAVGCHVLLWPAVACCGLLWAVVSCCGLLWAAVACCVLSCPVVGCCGLSCPVVTHRPLTFTEKLLILSLLFVVLHVAYVCLKEPQTIVILGLISGHISKQICCFPLKSLKKFLWVRPRVFLPNYDSIIMVIISVLRIVHVSKLEPEGLSLIL